MDNLSAEARSRTMSRIRSKDTVPELVVRRYLHGVGLRYRLHHPELPGKPDLVFARRRVCLFVHGCFWHGCPRCPNGQQKVQSNTGYWIPKLARNRARDRASHRALRLAGWTVLVIWACQTTHPHQLAQLASRIKRRPYPQLARARWDQALDQSASSSSSSSSSRLPAW
jgi:DNA mismatch endonuclease, patch repair protein